MLKEIKNYYPSGQIHQHYWVDEKGNPQGEYKSWYKNGQLQEHRFYKNGNIDGEFKSWYENGQLIVHCFHKNGLLNGEYKQWHENGQLEIHCFYHNDKAVDISEYVADINNITEEEHFLLQITFGYFPLIQFVGKPQ